MVFFLFLSDLNLSALPLDPSMSGQSRGNVLMSCSDAPHVDHKDGQTKHVDTDEEFDDSVYHIYI